MSARRHQVLYGLLFVWMAISMSYYLAGVAALYQQRLHPEGHVRWPFNLDDLGLTLLSVEKEAKTSGSR